jgi:hypothetical protein
VVTFTAGQQFGHASASIADRVYNHNHQNILHLEQYDFGDAFFTQIERESTIGRLAGKKIKTR